MSKQKKIKVILAVVLFLRLFTPFLIFKQPLLAFVLSQLFDAVDGQLFYNSGFNWKQYNLVDKLFDQWWYLFILFFLLGKSVSLIPLFLLVYRAVGMLYVLVTQKEDAYLLFPNILEWFFLVGLISPNLNMSIALTISLVWALFVEWLIHKSENRIISKFLFRNEIVWKKDERK